MSCELFLCSGVRFRIILLVSCISWRVLWAIISPWVLVLKLIYCSIFTFLNLWSLVIDLLYCFTLTLIFSFCINLCLSELASLIFIFFRHNQIIYSGICLIYRFVEDVVNLFILQSDWGVVLSWYSLFKWILNSRFLFPLLVVGLILVFCCLFFLLFSPLHLTLKRTSECVLVPCLVVEVVCCYMIWWSLLLILNLGFGFILTDKDPFS